MTAPTCVRCGRPTADGYACVDEMRKARGHLATVVDMTPPARDVARRQTSHSPGDGDAGSPLPLDLGATERLDQVQNTLVGWVRLISEQRGLDYTPHLGRSNT